MYVYIYIYTYIYIRTHTYVNTYIRMFKIYTCKGKTNGISPRSGIFELF